MRNILLAIVVAVLPAAIAAAEQSGTPKPGKPATSVRQLPVKDTATGDSCAAYGAGFVKVEGTDTCVKIGGAVSIGAGSSRAGH
jgi:Porin subfamily